MRLRIIINVPLKRAEDRFYRDILGFEEISFGSGRKAIKSGSQKINLHQVGSEIAPHSEYPTPGSGDICFICEGDLDSIIRELKGAGIAIEAGPVNRTGAMGTIRGSVASAPSEARLC